MDRRWELSSEMNRAFEWTKWMQEIPYISFPSHWKIKMTPPFAGAMIRFRVSNKDEKVDTSVYLDCYDILGFVGEPYWEIYPIDGDTRRVPMEDIDGLLEAIDQSLYSQLKKIND